MTKQIDVVIRNEEQSLLDLIRTSSSLPLARMRGGQVHPSTHKELIKLVQKLFLSQAQNNQMVVFSAVKPGSGCTFVCTRTAEILANQLEEPVCLVDANFRSPRNHEQFELENEAAGPHDDEWTFMPVGQNYGGAKKSKFWMAVYRPTSADCPRLGSLERFQTLIENLRKEFTFILIDAPPLSQYADASLLAKTADGLVMVLEANDTRRETAQKMKAMLDTADIPVLGAVLNRRTFPIPEFVYKRL